MDTGAAPGLRQKEHADPGTAPGPRYNDYYIELFSPTELMANREIKELLG